MKTLESVLKAISIESDKCEHCNAKEGAEHPLEGLKVELNALPGEEEFKKYCQICYIERSKKTQKEKKKDMIQLIKKLGYSAMLVIIVIVIFTLPTMAQPGLPGNPAQAPIDGGLGMLAAAGGLYAWNKFCKKSDS